MKPILLFGWRLNVNAKAPRSCGGISETMAAFILKTWNPFFPRERGLWLARWLRTRSDLSLILLKFLGELMPPEQKFLSTPSTMVPTDPLTFRLLTVITWFARAIKFSLLTWDFSGAAGKRSTLCPPSVKTLCLIRRPPSWKSEHIYMRT